MGKEVDDEYPRCTISVGLPDGKSVVVKLSNEIIVSEFHRLFYSPHTITWERNRWFGEVVSKCPFDCWIYQEILYETKPDIIIETGTSEGGSALFFASICELMGVGKVISIDIEDEETVRKKWKGSETLRPEHKRITYLLGDSVSSEIEEAVRGLIGEEDRVMVVLDSDHDKSHVLKELQVYSKFVSVGCYLIVEDTNIFRNIPENSPRKAIEEFMIDNDKFQVDRSRERLLLTFNPGGYLRRLIYESNRLASLVC